MNAISRNLIADNSTLRGLTGQGQPGLATLLGGTSPELSADGLPLIGSGGRVSAVSRVARTYKDSRIAGVSSGGGWRAVQPIENPNKPFLPGIKP